MFMKRLLPVPLHPKKWVHAKTCYFYIIYIYFEKNPNHQENYLYQLFYVDGFSFSLFNVACLIEEMSEKTIQDLS